MRIRPYMAEITYNHDVQTLEKGKTLEILNVEKRDGVSYDFKRKRWYTQNHYRKRIKNKAGASQVRMLQLAITIEADDLTDLSVYFVSNQDSIRHEQQLYFYHEKNIWFELSRFENTKEAGFYKYDSRRMVAGVAHAGSLDIVVKKGREVIKKEPITFYPSAISVKDYEVMTYDLFRIREDLLRNDRSTVSLGIIKQNTSAQLERVVERLEAPLLAINRTPASMLSFRWESGKVNQGEKYRIQTEIEKELYPGKNKYSVFKGYENVALEENKLIKHQLIKLKKYCQFYQSTSPLIQADEQQLNNERQILLNAASNRIKDFFRDILTEERWKLHTIEKLLTSLQAEVAKIQAEERQEKENIDNYLKNLANSLQVNQISLVPVKISCVLRSAKYNKSVSRSWRLETKISSNWIDTGTKKVVPLQYGKRYEYYWNGKWYEVTNRTQFFQITNTSFDLKSHWHLWKALEKAETNLVNDEGTIPIEIQGYAIPLRSPNATPTDVFGKESSQEGYMDYNFEIVDIANVIIASEKFDPTCDEETMRQEVLEFILPFDDKIKKVRTKFENLEFDLKEVERLKRFTLHEKKQTISQAKFAHFLEKIDEWLALPLFRALKITGKERLKPSQLFLHDPHYRSIWKSLNDLEEEIGMSLIPEIGSNRVGVQKVEEVFEKWILFKMLHLLTTEMGWTLQRAKDVVSYLDHFIIPGSRDPLKNFTAIMTKEDWLLHLASEPIIYDTDKNYVTPDYVFRLYRKENGRIKEKGIIYLDAKHRSYLEQGERKWKDDIDEVA
ncbi:MAG TPA: hypothetical protein VK085_12700, partial [Pseudogracilibacillus sp.]|nr:hypothetical protein [Pseudogracilibacillus sp.]